jgi:hypothetical protein
MKNKSLLNPIIKLACIGLLTLSTLPSAFAAKWANQFTEFELPPSWACNLEGAEWVCQNTDEAKKKEAIIVLAAKLKGDQDSLDQYLAYLKAAKSYTSVAGKPMKSEPKFAKTVNLNGQPWVDALHMESEIPGFYTRYLATVKDDIGVLVTYSISKNKYQEYQKEFENLTRTLKVFRKSGGINVAPANTNLMNTQIPQTVSEGTVFPGGLNVQGGSDQRQAPRTASGGNDDLLMYGVIGAAVIALIIFKKKRG